MNKKLVFIAFVVSLGGFLFGFDAGIISGVMSFVGPEFDLSEMQSGWVVSSPSFAAMSHTCRFTHTRNPHTVA